MRKKSMRLGLNSLWGALLLFVVDENFVSNFHRIRNRRIIFLFVRFWVRNVADLSPPLLSARYKN